MYISFWTNTSVSSYVPCTLKTEQSINYSCLRRHLLTWISNVQHMYSTDNRPASSMVTLLIPSRRTCQAESWVTALTTHNNSSNSLKLHLNWHFFAISDHLDLLSAGWNDFFFLCLHGISIEHMLNSKPEPGAGVYKVIRPMYGRFHTLTPVYFGGKWQGTRTRLPFLRHQQSWGQLRIRRSITSSRNVWITNQERCPLSGLIEADRYLFAPKLIIALTCQIFIL